MRHSPSPDDDRSWIGGNTGDPRKSKKETKDRKGHGTDWRKDEKKRGRRQEGRVGKRNGTKREGRGKRLYRGPPIDFRTWIRLACGAFVVCFASVLLAVYIESMPNYVSCLAAPRESQAVVTSERFEVKRSKTNPCPMHWLNLRW